MHAMLMLAAAAQLAASQAPAPPVHTIDLVNFAYRPAPIRLAAGRPVTLQFVNRAGKGHDFTAAKFFRSARILSGRVEGGAVDLRGGQSARVTLIPAAGRYTVHCGRFGHKMLGMRAAIIAE